MDITNVNFRNRLYQLSKDSPSNYSERGNFIKQCTDSSNDPLTHHGINNFNRDFSTHIRSQHIIAIGSTMPSITNIHSISQSDEMCNGHLSIRGTFNRHDNNTDLHSPLSTSNSYLYPPLYRSIVTVNSDMMVYSSGDRDYFSECNQVIQLYDDPFDTFQNSV